MHPGIWAVILNKYSSCFQRTALGARDFSCRVSEKNLWSRVCIKGLALQPFKFLDSVKDYPSIKVVHFKLQYEGWKMKYLLSFCQRTPPFGFSQLCLDIFTHCVLKIICIHVSKLQPQKWKWYVTCSLLIFIPSSVRLGSEDFEDTFTHSGMYYSFASHLVHCRYIVQEVYVKLNC